MGRYAWTAVIAVIALVSIAVSAPFAQAAVRYDNVGSFGSTGGEDGQFAPTGRIAVDQSSGDLFVVDRGFNWGAPPRVEVFAPSGDSATYVTKFGGGTLSEPNGIAVDPATGSVYVADAGAEQIFKFDSDGQPTPSFSLDASFVSPGVGSAAGQVGSFAAPLAFDASAERLLLADPGNNRIDRFQSDGTFESSFDGSDSGTAFTSLKDIAVGPVGDVLVVDGARVERFEADGTHVVSVSGLPGEPDRVAYNGHGNEILVGHSGLFEAAVYRFDAESGQFVASFREEAPNWNGAVSGLAMAESSARLYVATAMITGFGADGVLVFAPRVLPDLVVAAPSAVTASAAHLSGTINPLGLPGTVWHFEYSKDGTNWTSTPDVAAGEGEAPEPVEADLNGLEPNTGYQVRLAASNGEGATTSSAVEFSTEAAPPAVVTGVVTDRTGTGATLRGTVNPFGVVTTYHFEYGTDTGYGSRVPLADDHYAGTGHSPKSVFARAEGLQAGVTYHYRLVAENEAGKSFGADRTFVSRPVSASARAYELVSPADKGDANVAAFRLTMATPDGSRFAYATTSPISAAGVSHQAPLYPQYLATRSGTGWSSIALDPPTLSTPGIGFAVYATLGISEDGSHAVVVSAKKLAPGGSEGDSNLYLFDTAAGTYETIATVPGVSFHDFARFDHPGGSRIVRGGTPDFGKLFLYGDSGVSFIPGAPPGALYEWTEGELHLASLRPDGEPFSAIQAVGFGVDRLPHDVSADGSRVFFQATEDGALYARVNGTETVPVSGGSSAVWGNASKDGRYAFTQVDHDIYRYDFETGDRTQIAEQANIDSAALMVSDDGSYVYYFSVADLAPGGEDQGLKLYVWHDETVRFVANFDQGNLKAETTPNVQRMISPNGRYLAFSSYGKPTGYNNSSQACTNVSEESDPPGGACRQIYRYDAVADELTCASCRRDGGHPTGNTNIAESTGIQIVNRHFPRSVLDSGEVIFDTPDPLSEADVNSKRDVYSFDGEEPILISAGTGSGDSTFLDATPDGKNVFFVTEDRLVGLDRDTQADVYDARVGGGIPAQNPPAPAPPCAGQDCRVESGSRPADPTAGSEATGANGTGNPGRHRRCAKGRHKRKVKGKVRCVKPSKHNQGRKHR